MEAVLSPVDHEKWVAEPVAFKFVSTPLQTVDGPLTLTVGAEYTISNFEAVLLQP